MTGNTIWTLEKRHHDIEDAHTRRECMHLIYGAIENANDTEGAEETPEWHAAALGSLESLIAYCGDVAVCKWFEEQGVKW